MRNHSSEVADGARFEFGANWSRFLLHLDDTRVADAMASLTTMLGVRSLDGKSFLDIGSGSGLFSLAARRLGASVYSFDFDPLSVACTRELRKRYFPDDPDWRIQEASILDPAFIASLETYDIAYSWGVLHHTGFMWEALDNAMRLVKRDGTLFIAL